MKLELRPAAYEHPDAVQLTAQAQDFYRQLYGGTDDSPLGDGELAWPNGAFLLGYLDGTPVAMGGWRFLPGTNALDAAHPAEIRRMFVTDAVRRQGLARTVLTALEASAAAAGADAMVLATGRPQVAAVRFYRASGYVDVPHFGHYAEMDDAVHLGRRLSPVSSVSLVSDGEPPGRTIPVDSLGPT